MSQQVLFYTFWGTCQHVDCAGACVRFLEGSDSGFSAPCGLCSHPRKDHIGRSYYLDGSGTVAWVDSFAAAISSIPAESNSVPPTFHHYNQHNPSNNSILSADSGSRNVRQRTSHNGQNGLGRAPPVGSIFGGAGSCLSSSSTSRATTPSVVAMISPPPISGNNSSSSSNSSLTVSPEQAEASVSAVCVFVGQVLFHGGKLLLSTSTDIHICNCLWFIGAFLFSITTNPLFCFF